MRFTPIILLLIVLFGLSSCKEEKQVELPYEEEKVIQILADMHFAKVAAKLQKSKNRDSLKLVFEDQVYTINEITKADYENLKRVLESDLNLYFEIEKKVHLYLKEVQNDKN